MTKTIAEIIRPIALSSLRDMPQAHAQKENAASDPVSKVITSTEPKIYVPLIPTTAAVHLVRAVRPAAYAQKDHARQNVKHRSTNATMNAIITPTI